MRFLTILAIAATLLWGGYWFVGARAVEQGVARILATTPEFQVDGHTLRGFPNRFDVTFDAPRLDLDTMHWQSDFLQIFALSYKPHHLLAVFANDQTMRLLDETATLHSSDMRASVVMEPVLSLPLMRTTLVGEDLELAMRGQTWRGETLRVATRRSGDSVHEWVIQADAIFPDTAFMDARDPERLWPRRIDTLRIDGTMHFDRILDRNALSGAPPRLDDMRVTGAQLAWQDGRIDAEGALTLDSQARVNGTMTLTVTGWEALFERARAAGMVPQDQEAFLRIALQGLRLPDDPDRIALPLIFEAGAVRLGPLQLGQVPALR